MAKTLLQHWLVNYICFKLEQFQSINPLQQTVCSGYITRIAALTDSTFKNDEHFVQTLDVLLTRIHNEETLLSKSHKRGNELTMKLRDMMWLVSTNPIVERILMGEKTSVVAIFRELGLQDIDITSFNKPNTDIDVFDLPQIEVLVLKRNIADYLVTKVMENSEEGAYSTRSETLQRTNCQKLKQFAESISRSLAARPIKTLEALNHWHNLLSESLIRQYQDLVGQRGYVPSTWLADKLGAGVCYFRSDEYLPSSDSISILKWTVDNLLKARSPLKSISIRAVLTKCFSELKERPEIFKLGQQEEARQAEAVDNGSTDHEFVRETIRALSHASDMKLSTDSGASVTDAAAAAAAEGDVRSDASVAGAAEASETDTGSYTSVAVAAANATGETNYTGLDDAAQGDVASGFSRKRSFG